MNPTTSMAKFGLNQLDNGRPNRIKCLGFENWGKHNFFSHESWETERALRRFFFDSSFSFSIPLPCIRFVFLFFVLLWFSFDSFDSPSISEAKNNHNPFDDQKQAFVVVDRVSTGIEAKLKVELISSLILVCSRTNHEMVNCCRWTFQVLYGSGARKFARSCCSSWLTSHEGIVSLSSLEFVCSQ